MAYNSYIISVKSLIEVSPIMLLNIYKRLILFLFKKTFTLEIYV
jgi:hypothetical protein